MLEIRVHGVHGTSPASMLGVDAGAVRQVAGDGLTGVFRAEGDTLPGRTLPDNVAVEAYSWGALTSGVSGLLGWVRRAAWLVLVPFALVNLAYWARPELASGKPTARWSARLVRVSGLLVTVFMVLTPAVIGIDLVAWQCYRGGSTGCPVLPGVLDFMARNPWDEAPRRLAIGSLLPLAVILVLWLLSRASLIRCEEVDERPPGDLAKGVPDVLPVLRHRWMWSGKERTLRLQRLHLALAVCVVICYSGLPVIVAGADHRASGVWPYDVLVGVDALAVLAALAVFVLACAIREDDLEHPDTPGEGAVAPHDEVAGPLLLLVLGLLVAHVAMLMLPHYQGLDESGDLYGHNLWFIVVFVALTTIHLMVFVIGRGGRLFAAALGISTPVLFAAASDAIRTEGGFPFMTVVVAWAGLLLLMGILVVWHTHRHVPTQAWGGAGSSVFLGAAAWIALLFTTSAVTLTANYLNGPDHSVGDLQATDDAGKVTVDGAVIDVSARGDVFVRTGKIVVDSLSRADTTVGTDPVEVELGTTEAAQSLLSVPEGPVAILDSCVRFVSERPGPRSLPRHCSVESPDFVAAGEVNLPAASSGLRLGSGARRVVLKVVHPPQTPLVLPQVLVWAPLAQLLWIIAVAVVVLCCVLRLRRRVRPAVEALARVPEEGISGRDVDSCAAQRTRAAFIHRTERLLDLVGSVTSPVAIALILLASTGKSPWQVWENARPLASVAMWTILGVSAGIVLVASRMRTSEKTRKAVGIVWDLTTFWPRAAHPLAPPCYAERVVPELRTRVRWALDSHPDTHVVLSGHSQGSALVMAVASRLGDRALDRVRVITYGSQLRAWYGRIFPAVLGPTSIGGAPTRDVVRFRDVAPDVPGKAAPMPWSNTHGSLVDRISPPSPDLRWVNLFRRSDPLGFRVFTDVDTSFDVYVCEVPAPTAGDPGPHVLTHSGYPHSLPYLATVTGWEQEVPPVPDAHVVVKHVRYLPPQ